jgi:hypothetical protein
LSDRNAKQQLSVKLLFTNKATPQFYKNGCVPQHQAKQLIANLAYFASTVNLI